MSFKFVYYNFLKASISFLGGIDTGDKNYDISMAYIFLNILKTLFIAKITVL